jgi:hypothetical protein
MTPLTRLVGMSILVVSLFGVALADGGVAQGPPIAQPPSECNADYSETQASAPTQPAQDSTVDIVTTAEIFAAWLAQTIL